MKIKRYCIIETNKQNYQSIIHSYSSMYEPRIFVSRKSANDFMKVLKEARGDSSTFEIVKLEGETKQTSDQSQG